MPYSKLIYLHERPNGTTFGVAKADCELPRRAARGDVVTFTHDLSRRMGTQDLLAQDNTQTQWAQRGAQTRPTQEAVRGMPANIVVHRIRTDVIWEDVVNTSVQPVRQFHNSLPLPPPLLYSLCHFNQICSHLLQSRTRRSMLQRSRSPLVSFYFVECFYSSACPHVNFYYYSYYF